MFDVLHIDNDQAAEVLRDAAYEASVDLARERGGFPLFNADLYLSGTSFADMKAMTEAAWSQCCIEVEWKEPLFIDNDAYNNNAYNNNTC